jgi:peptidoglycan/LPS O-acetylase OafA/YrhL
LGEERHRLRFALDLSFRDDGSYAREALAPATEGWSRLTLNHLTSLRAAAALAVFFFHLRQYGQWQLPLHQATNGYAGVGFFFVLSGFILVISTPAGDTAPRFYRRRFARIYPAYFVMTLVAVAMPVVAVSRSLASTITSLTLIQAWVPVNDRIAYGANGVGWSLSCELAFYLAFPLLLPRLRRVPVGQQWAIASAWLAAAFAFAAIASPHGEFWYTAADVSPLTEFPAFLLGVIAGLAVANGWRPRIPVWLVAGALATLTVLTSYVSVRDAPAYFAYVPLFVCLIIAIAMRDLDQRSGWLTHPLLIYAGQVSFCFYLVHEIVIINLVRVHSGGLAIAGVMLVASCAGAVALHHLVELPCHRLLRGRQQRTSAIEPQLAIGHAP